MDELLIAKVVEYQRDFSSLAWVKKQLKATPAYAIAIA